MSMSPPPIDRARLRTALRKLEDQYVFAMLYEAIERLPEPELAAIAARFLPIEGIIPAGESSQGLVAEVQAFDRQARQGGYFVTFVRNSENCMDLSKGTRAFAAECCRLLERCVLEASHGELAAVRTALEVLFALLKAVDRTDDGIVFFADEGGVWAFGINWPPVFRAWFQCLAKFASPYEYARFGLAAIDDFQSWRRDELVAIAVELGDERQSHAIRSLAANGR